MAIKIDIIGYVDEGATAENMALPARFPEEAEVFFKLNDVVGASEGVGRPHGDSPAEQPVDDHQPDEEYSFGAKETRLANNSFYFRFPG